VILYDVESEKHYLGIIASVSVLDPKKARNLMESNPVKQSDFSAGIHSSVFENSAYLLGLGMPIDATTVSKVVYGLEELLPIIQQDHLHEAILPACANRIRAMSQRRDAYGKVKTAQERLSDTSSDVGQVVSDLTAGLASTPGRAPIQTLTDVFTSMAGRLDDVQAGRTRPVVPTGIGSLDAIIGGLQPTLTLLGALPGVGKSAFIATVIQSLAQRGVKVGIFSLEDEPSWLAYRLLSHESGVNQYKLRFERLNKTQLEAAAEGWAKAAKYDQNVMVVDGSDSSMGLDEIVQKSAAMILNHGVRVILIDHLGEISRKHGDRTDLEISTHLSRLRGIANRFGVPVVVAAHFKRREGLGPANKPALADFADSSGAERKARVALGLSREPNGDTISIHVLKNTNGMAGLTATAKFHGAAAMLREIEGNDY
jgi:replicative DNA helicase